MVRLQAGVATAGCCRGYCCLHCSSRMRRLEPGVEAAVEVARGEVRSTGDVGRGLEALMLPISANAHAVRQIKRLKCVHGKCVHGWAGGGDAAFSVLVNHSRGVGGGVSVDRAGGWEWG